MKFSDVTAASAGKKTGSLRVCGEIEKTALDFWTKRGGKIRWFKGDVRSDLEAALAEAKPEDGDAVLCSGVDDARVVSCVPRADRAPDVTILMALELTAYPKLLWIGFSPLCDYTNIVAASASLQTMIASLQKLGEAAPRVALLSCVELVTPGVKSTLWQAPLAQMSARGQFGKACVDGPLGLDLAVSPEAVREKKVKTDIAGEADLLVPPDFGSFLSLTDAVMLTGEHRAAGVILGAPVPIAFPPLATPDHIERSVELASLLV
ncbi:MAG: phosphate acyltransferase [bacterium]|nr:phosphate acyltransferase [bacterium]